MGYLTYFTADYEIRTPFPETDEEKFVRQCQEKGIEVPKSFDVGMNAEDRMLEDNVSENYCMRFVELLGGTDHIKWYDCDSDMRDFSKRYPNVLFEIIGDGENSEDHWKCYYLNGKCQREDVEIKFPDFDESKLT